MRAVTWIPNSDKDLDHLFNELRKIQHNNTNHPLWQNYNKEHFYSECSALSISFDEHDVPIFCSSILKRACWPNQVYRIINRLWKVSPISEPLKNSHPALGPMLYSQLDWLEKNTNCELVFISRETPNWQRWTIKQLAKNYNLHFGVDDYKYLTCSNSTDDSCWQHIIYQGNIKLLTHWQKKLDN